MTPVALAPSERLGRGERVRAVANLLNGSTLLGLGVARLGHCRVRRGPRGLWLADRYRFGFPRAGAFTVGDVLLTSDEWPARVQVYPGLLAHEERHAWQYAVCGGLPFIPLYVLAMAWSVLRTGTLGARNVFERDAGLAAGGYLDAPVVPLRPRLRRLVGA